MRTTEKTQRRKNDDKEQNSDEAEEKSLEGGPEVTGPTGEVILEKVMCSRPTLSQSERRISQVLFFCIAQGSSNASHEK